jgi:hypothetical protein
MTVRQATSEGRGFRPWRRRSPPTNRLEVVAVDFDDVPVGDPKSRGDVFADRQQGSRPSSVIRLSSHSRISLPRRRCPRARSSPGRFPPAGSHRPRKA